MGPIGKEIFHNNSVKISQLCPSLNVPWEKKRVREHGRETQET